MTVMKVCHELVPQAYAILHGLADG
jgi:hypothetical protein